MGTGAGTGTAGSTALLLSGARLADGRSVDVRISGERIEAVGTVGSLSAPERLDLSGYLLVPSPVEPHAHLDEAFTAGGPGAAPTAATGEELRRRITEAALTSLGYGATAVRSQILVDGEAGLRRLEGALQAARDLRGLVDLQVAAMPGPLTGSGGHEARELLREALRAGAHALGGRPAQDPDPAGHLGTLLALAREYGRPLDLHANADLAGELPESGPDAMLCLDGGVTPRQLEALLRAGTGVVVLPQSGRCAGRPTPIGGYDPAAVQALAAVGVPLAAGSGALRDACCPVGRADPLEAAFLLAATAGLAADAAYDAVSATARTLLGLAAVRVEAGYPAELLAVRGDTLTAALAGGHSRVVVHGGRVVSRTSAVREYAETTAAAVPRQVRPGPT
ncbi:cytosine deaminase [Streptacidiphilus sp. MAP12-20]|uniref:hydrolase n=1 Tax=Streptacidiphilus sp. MAP12-20 TaxID=3156299 RepID=UPI003511EAAD